MNTAEPAAEAFPLLHDLLTRRLTLVAAVLMGLVFALNAGAYALAIAASDGLLTPYGLVIGGDFVAFDTAASMAAQGEAASAYDASLFADRLAQDFPSRGAFNLNWPYPPTMFLAAAPMALFPYLASYWIWVAAGLLAFGCAIRTISPAPMAAFAALASPAVYQAVITGQTGLFTAALVIAAAMQADRRPVLAGIAAGVLTLKPQLGLLIPVAFACAGCWRAFAAAAATAGLLALAAAGVFGAGIWQAFAASAGEHAARLQSGAFPFEKVVSVYGGARMIGLSFAPALLVQAGATLALAAAVGAVWRRTKDRALRTAALCAAIPLATPYAMYYELPLMLPALVVLAQRGVQTGWLPGEKIAVAALWLAPMFILISDARPGVPLGLVTTAALFACVMRRAAAGGALNLSSARPDRSFA